MASPSWEVPAPKATLVRYSLGALLYMSAMMIPAGLVATSVATMAPLMVASGSSWNQMPGSLRGYTYCGAVVGAPWVYSVALLVKGSHRCVRRIGLNSRGQRVWGKEGHVQGPLVGVPQALVGSALGGCDGEHCELC